MSTEDGEQFNVAGVTVKRTEIEHVTFKRDGHTITVSKDEVPEKSPTIKGFAATGETK